MCRYDNRRFCSRVLYETQKRFRLAECIPPKSAGSRVEQEWCKLASEHFPVQFDAEGFDELMTLANDNHDDFLKMSPKKRAQRTSAVGFVQHHGIMLIEPDASRSIHFDATFRDIVS